MSHHNRRNKGRDLSGFYSTPAWVTEALLKYEKFQGIIREPSCGDGAISKVLEATGYQVKSTDLFDRGYGEAGIDYLTDNRTDDNVIMNPPYELLDHFIYHALQRTRRKVAVIVRLGFLGGQERFEKLWSVEPPARILLFCKRPTMAKPKIRNGRPHLPKAVDYCWVIWDHRYNGLTAFNWTIG